MSAPRGILAGLLGVERARARLALCVRGEACAADHLRRLGFEELARNLRVGHDEADLIMMAPDGRTVVIVEVKTRADSESWPELRIDHGKRSSLTRLARTLLEQPALAQLRARFDVVAINWPEGQPPSVRHFEDAWEASGL